MVNTVEPETESGSKRASLSVESAAPKVAEATLLAVKAPVAGFALPAAEEVGEE